MFFVLLSSSLTIPDIRLDWFARSKMEVLPIVKQHNQRSWTQRKDPVDGSRWEGNDDLQETGSMFRTTMFHMDNKEIYATVMKAYGKFHQYGTSNIPQRRWLGINGFVVERIGNIFGKNLLS